MTYGGNRRNKGKESFFKGTAFFKPLCVFLSQTCITLHVGKTKSVVLHKNNSHPEVNLKSQMHKSETLERVSFKTFTPSDLLRSH